MKKVIFASIVVLLLMELLMPSCRHELGPLPILPIDPEDTIVTPPPPPEDPIDTTGVPCDPDTVYFQNQILPLMISNCAMAGCHDPITHEEGIILSDYAHIRAKVTPFNPNQGKIYKSIIDTDPGDRMPPPPASALTTDQKNLIKKWIEQGALNNVCNESYGLCDTSGVSYTNYLQPLIANKCLGCHGTVNPGGGILLRNYDEVKASALTGKFYGSILWSAGFVAMPENGTQLSSCQTSKIKAWMDTGMPQ